MNSILKNITKTLDCLNFFKNRLDKFNVSKYRCVADRGMRRTAINSDFFLNEVKKMSNLDIEINSHQRGKQDFDNPKVVRIYLEFSQ